MAVLSRIISHVRVCVSVARKYMLTGETRAHTSNAVSGCRRSDSLKRCSPNSQAYVAFSDTRLDVSTQTFLARRKSHPSSQSYRPDLILPLSSACLDVALCCRHEQCCHTSCRGRGLSKSMHTKVMRSKRKKK